MECTQKQQIIPNLELPSTPQSRRINKSKEIDVYDKKAAEYRRYLASEEALREMARRKDLSIGGVHRMSFIR